MTNQFRWARPSLKKPAILLAALWTFSSCALFDSPTPSPASLKRPTPQRVYYAPYDKVWNAALAVIKYSIAQNNQDTGYIETESIKGSEGWLPPDVEKKPSAGIKYKLILTFTRGKIEGRESTRVSLQKKIEVQRDFFSEPESMNSDGLEEKVIFYRIERELLIAEALRKASQPEDVGF